jgi:cytochrome c oxidase assembly protein subunit 11
MGRVVTVEFTGTVMPGLPWEMRPLTGSLDLHPGELHQAKFLVHNNSDRTIVGQAVPSVSPGQAAQHFEKLDCFCFSQQTLAPGETKELPLTFIVKPEIDEQIRTVTLSYAFFNVAGDKSAPKERE